jgi:hypothetical protein
LVRNKTLWLNDEYRTSDFIGDAEDVLWWANEVIWSDVVNNLTSERDCWDKSVL